MTNELISGRVFVAYRGYEFENDEISLALYGLCPNDEFDVKERKSDNALFAKVVIDNFMIDPDPDWYYNFDVKSCTLLVSGYNTDEICEAKDNIDDLKLARGKNHSVIDSMYKIFGTSMFKKASNYMHFCSVIYDPRIDSMIAGVTEPNSKYTHLFYGYTKLKKDLIFSNDGTILKKFCYDEEIYEMPKNTYMKDGELYSLEGIKIDNINSNTRAYQKRLGLKK